MPAKKKPQRNKRKRDLHKSKRNMTAKEWAAQKAFLRQGKKYKNGIGHKPVKRKILKNHE